MSTQTGQRVLRIGLIGLGRAGGLHLEAIQGVSDAAVVAVCDPVPSALQRAEAAGLSAYAGIEAMLDDAVLDAAVVCTPPDEHARTVAACLERGLDVLCEKPLALTRREVHGVLQAALRARRQVLVASKFRHVPALVRARELIHSGMLGEPACFEVSFASVVDMGGRWNSNPARSGGGVIVDNGSHAFDIVSFLFGRIDRVRAERIKALQPLTVEDSATIQVWAGDGVLGRIDLSWSLPIARDSYVVVHGSRGTVEVGWRESRVKFAGGAWQEIGEAYDKLDAHRAMIARFVRVVRGTDWPWMTGVECLQVLGAIDASYRSLGSGRVEPVDVPLDRRRPAGSGRAVSAVARRAAVS